MSKVYFTDMKTIPSNNLLNKTEILCKKAGIDTIDFNNKFAALKIHFGEPGNLAYLRPNYVKIISNIVKNLGGTPFLTDCSTLYTGRRSNAVDHLDSAIENGFSYLSTGCNIIIGDGLKGTEYHEIEINQKHCKTAKIGSAIVDADIFISLNHFKGHEMTGFGGALKNIGMGCGSRGGKMEMHSSSQPQINQNSCISCGMCIKCCSQNAISFNQDKKAKIDYSICIGCGQCIAVCQYDAVSPAWDESGSSANEKIAEYSLAVLKDKPNFHINFIMNVSPDCDCWGYNDVPISPDIGIAASFDPVALDKACVDLVNKAPVIPGSKLDSRENDSQCEDKFGFVHINTDWEAGLKYAEKIGLGEMDYELIKI